MGPNALRLFAVRDKLRAHTQGSVFSAYRRCSEVDRLPFAAALLHGRPDAWSLGRLRNDTNASLPGRGSSVVVIVTSS